MSGMASHRRVTEPTVRGKLFVVGSRDEHALAQRAALLAAGVLPLPVLAMPDLQELEAVRKELRAGNDVAVFPAPAMPVVKEKAARVAELLADVVEPLLTVASTVVLTGGETAHAVLRRSGVEALHIIGELEPGVVLSTVPGRDLSVITKAGSFGDNQVLVRRLHHTIRRSGA